jgi:putative endonuclease
MSLHARQKALRRGATAEWLAAGYLMLKGYRLIARRVGGKGGEIDLVMRRGGTIAFIEVKSRASRDMALMAVTPEKVRLIGKTARLWMARNPWSSGMSFRGDVVAFGGVRRPAHVENAFEIVMM